MVPNAIGEQREFAREVPSAVEELRVFAIHINLVRHIKAAKQVLNMLALSCQHKDSFGIIRLAAIHMVLTVNSQLNPVIGRLLDHKQAVVIGLNPFV